MIILLQVLCVGPSDEYQLGTVSTIQANDVHYALRVPKDYSAARGAPAIIFLHGSNMQGESYARSLEVFHELADWILIAPTGPMKTGDQSYNHNPGDERYVASVLNDVEKRLKIKTTRLYVGGHSQGAFLSHAVAAHLADRIDGVIAVSGGSWINPFHLLRKGGKSGEIPVALVHGQDDPVVPFAVSVSIYDAYRKVKHEDVRLFAPTEGAHMFLRLPIIAAWQWLELMNETRREKLLEILNKTDAAKDPRTVWTRSGCASAWRRTRRTPSRRPRPSSPRRSGSLPTSRSAWPDRRSPLSRS
ncbi:MAG: alpha/beta fold hydrolase [Planctomycetota bacterium]